MRVENTLQENRVTLGILAGGRATRLGGRDKAWLERGGVPQVLRIVRRFEGECCAVLVSANRELSRYAEHGLAAIADRVAGFGPLAGIDAMAAQCTTPWLLTLPVDIVNTNDCLLRTLAQVGGDGAVAEDDDGPQPLVALYRCEPLRRALSAMVAEGQLAPRQLEQRLGLGRVRLRGVRFGNLNTPQDLAAARIALP